MFLTSLRESIRFIHPANDAGLITPSLGYFQDKFSQKNCTVYGMHWENLFCARTRERGLVSRRDHSHSNWPGRRQPPHILHHWRDVTRGFPGVTSLTRYFPGVTPHVLHHWRQCGSGVRGRSRRGWNQNTSSTWLRDRTTGTSSCLLAREAANYMRPLLSDTVSYCLRLPAFLPSSACCLFAVRCTRFCFTQLSTATRALLPTGLFICLFWFWQLRDSTV